MTDFPPLILTSTFHEPQFRLKNCFLKALPDIKKLFPLRVACCTPSTSNDVIDFLAKEDFLVKKSPSIAQIDAYSLALRSALELMDDRSVQRIIYIDLDRLVHWVNFYPIEISNLVEEIDVDYLHLGRSARAFETHPETQKDTEIVVNEIASRTLEFEHTKDIISACFVVNVELGEKLLTTKSETSMGFYCSWPVKCWLYAESKKYLEVEGLEWETPDRFQEEINEQGYEKWMEQFQTAREWQKRTGLMRECLIELTNLVKLSFM